MKVLERKFGSLAVPEKSLPSLSLADESYSILGILPFCPAKDYVQNQTVPLYIIIIMVSPKEQSSLSTCLGLDTGGLL